MRNRPKFIVIMLALIILALIIYLPGGRMSHANALTTAQKPNVALSQFYAQHNLLSDGAVPADLTNSAVVNAWGLVSGPTTPWWIADNGTGKTTLYNVSTGTIQATFTVPGVGTDQGNPTGLVFNGGTGFVVNNGMGSSAARFIFASEDGTLSAFRGNPIVTVVPNAEAQLMMLFIKDWPSIVRLRVRSCMQPISTTAESIYLIARFTPSP